MDSGGVRPSLPSAAAAGGTSVPDEPRDARVVRELLRSMGLGEGDVSTAVLTMGVNQERRRNQVKKKA
ncbi:unnamed protein product [Triticum turgidum subsp. durum]|uniref:Uncharacterized protein n=1 Tax=Triticum turgidum subsp. durum TaxID=4567 RepID=A0A9R1QS22_TRITD|nr:unnamed protein product [Triticum turgidum subsp. durum]